MPIIFPGSSEQTIRPPMPSEVVDKLAELASDEPLPDTYPGDRIRLLAQSPRKLYLYWGLARDPITTLERAFGSQAQQYSLVVRLTDTDSGEQVFHLASPTKSQWLDVRPGVAYRVDLGLFAPGRAFVRLLSSNVVQTPRSGVARSADAAPAWQISAEKFARVLDEAGYVSDALEVTLEAIDEQTGDAATRAIAATFNDAEIPMMTEENLIEMRRILSALAFGADFNNLRSALSPSLSDWFSRAGTQSLVMNSERLVETLRTLFGIEMSRLPDDQATEEAMRRVARVVVGASEINLPARPFHLWMPSMNIRRLSSIVPFAD